MMQQPYVKPVYGSSLNNPFTSNYGTVNPGPSAVPKLIEFPSADQVAAGEMLGNAADESNTAQYTPTVHTIEVELNQRLKSKFYPEGTLLSLEPTTDQNVVRGRRLVRATTKMRASDTDFPESAHVRPIAADCDFTRQNLKTVMVPIAYTGTQRISLKNCTVNRDGLTTIAAGTPVFAIPADDELIIRFSSGPGLALQDNPTNTGAVFMRRLGILTLPLFTTDDFMTVNLLPQ